MRRCRGRLEDVPRRPVQLARRRGAQSATEALTSAAEVAPCEDKPKPSAAAREASRPSPKKATNTELVE